MGKERPIMIIERKRILHFKSIREAEKATQISHQRILRALNSNDGIIPGTWPPITVDDEMDIEDDDMEF